MHDVPPQGSIDDIFLPRLLAGLHLREFEGMLRLILPDSIKVLYFKKGEIASAASNAEPDRLASILIRDGRLTTEQLDLARSRLQAGASLGKALIEMGFLTPTELLQGARQQVRVIVASCFAAATGVYEMVPGPLPAEVTSLGLNTRRLLFDCLMEAGNRAAVIREVGSMEAVYRPTGQLNFALMALKLDLETDRIGRLLNGTANLRDISGRTSHDDLTVSKVVLALDLLGAVEKVAPAEEATPAAGRGRTIPIVSEAQEESAAPAVVEIAGAAGVAIMKASVETQAPAALTAAAEEVFPGPGPTAAIAVTEVIDTTSPLVPPADPAADEPPPIPQDELPAFAQLPGESLGGSQPAPAAVAGPQWQIDPVTGERVHVGPIEMTFDGRIAAGRGDPKRFMWILLAAGALTLVVAGALGYVVLRRGAGAPAGTGPPVASRTAATEPVPGTETPVRPPSGNAPAGGPDETVPVPGAPVAAPLTQAVPPPTPTPEEPPRGEASGSIADPRFGSALRRLDQGDPAGAARLFEEWVLSENRGRYSLQLMIACQEDTLKGARSHAGTDGFLFILPYSLKGRSCYRICWGVYNDGDSARAAVPAVPSALTGGSLPVVLPLSRLRPSD